MFKLIVGVLMVLSGIALGFYVGGYIMFYGGIVQIITACKAGFEATGIAMGILRVLGTGLAGYISALFLVIPGVVVINAVK